MRSEKFGFDNDQVDELANQYIVEPVPLKVQDENGDEVDQPEDENIKYFNLEKLTKDL
jgi:hypothetical protein